MKRVTGFGFIVVAAVMAVQTSLSAQQNLRITNRDNGPGRSGLISTNRTVLRSSLPGNWVLSKILWREVSDQACILAVEFWSIQNGQRRTTTRTLNGCTHTGNVGFQGWRELAADRPRRAIDGIRVCTNNRSGPNHEMKGLRAFFSQVGRNPSARVAGGMQEKTYVNCRTWHDVRRCPAGKVARGLVIHH